MLNMMLIIIPTIFVFLIHPISMGSLLLIQTILITLTLGMINLNYWYSYILFIIMIGGLLILFIYMTSVASNEKFKMSNYLMFLIMLLIMVMMITLLIDHYLLNLNNFNFNMNKLTENLNYSYSSKYINFPLNYSFIMTIIYLLICLIASIKIASTYKGPMRQNN